MTLPVHYKLGRSPSIRDPRTLRLASYADPSRPSPPPERRWDASISDWGVMGNDDYGNCVIVTPAHMLLSWRANELGDFQRITDAAVIDLSRSMGAMNGFNILDRLKYWRKHSMWSDFLYAFASVDPRDRTLLKDVVNTFGAADIGLNMPLGWQGQEVWGTGHGPRWRPNTWGGHSVPILGYDETLAYVCTWGAIQAVTWEAIETYCDEAYACLDGSWIASDGISPSGFDLTRLHADLKEVSG